MCQNFLNGCKNVSFEAVVSFVSFEALSKGVPSNKCSYEIPNILEKYL